MSWGLDECPRWTYPRLAHGLVFMVIGRYLRYITIVLILFSECNRTWGPEKSCKLALSHDLPHTTLILREHNSRRREVASRRGPCYCCGYTKRLAPPGPCEHKTFPVSVHLNRRQQYLLANEYSNPCIFFYGTSTWQNPAGCLRWNHGRHMEDGTI